MVMIMTVLPVHAVQARLFADQDTNIGKTMMDHQAEPGSVLLSEHCKSNGCGSPDHNMDNACDQAGCDQCGSCVTGLTEESHSGFIIPHPADYLLSALNTTLSYQVIPPFRPPRA